MGGFQLYGPTYKIYKTNEKEHCLCHGYVSRVNQEIEDYFVKRIDKKISKTDFVNITKCGTNCHLGDEDEFSYEIVLRGDPSKEYLLRHR